MTDRQMLQFDHIAVFARTLEEGAAHIKRCLGIDMPTGGAHPRMGTHNLLLSLGENSFLEVIAIDPQAPAPQRARWFGLDTFDAEPVLGTWVLGTDDLHTEAARSPSASGPVIEMTRGALNWLICVPQDGSMPLDGAFPTLIEWPKGPHPAVRMIDLGCRLKSLVIEHPQADQILAQIGDRLDLQRITIRTAPAKSISAQIETPDGMRWLS